MREMYSTVGYEVPYRILYFVYSAAVTVWYRI